jgi:aminoglycoside 6'-N-acetyltransferase
MSDVDDLHEYQSHPDIVRYIPWPERTRDEVIEAIAKTIATGKSELVEDGDYIVLGWEVKNSPAAIQSLGEENIGKVIGQSNMGLRSKRDMFADIGWVTHQGFQRRGLAFEATRALMAFGFNSCNLHRLIADIDTKNPESARLAEKLGMRLEAEFIDSEMFKGDWCSMWLYAILAREFKSAE